MPRCVETSLRVDAGRGLATARLQGSDAGAGWLCFVSHGKTVALTHSHFHSPLQQKLAPFPFCHVTPPLISSTRLPRLFS